MSELKSSVARLKALDACSNCESAYEHELFALRAKNADLQKMAAEAASARSALRQQVMEFVSALHEMQTQFCSCSATDSIGSCAACQLSRNGTELLRAHDDEVRSVAISGLANTQSDLRSDLRSMGDAVSFVGDLARDVANTLCRLVPARDAEVWAAATCQSCGAMIVVKPGTADHDGLSNTSGDHARAICGWCLSADLDAAYQDLDAAKEQAGTLVAALEKIARDENAQPAFEIAREVLAAHEESPQ